MVDPLYWMWDEDPIHIGTCREYLVPYFPGAPERIARHDALHPDDPRPRLVDPVYDSELLATLPPASPDGSLLVNFGGMTSPLGCNTDLAVAMTESMLGVLRDRRDDRPVRFCTSSGVATALRREAGVAGPIASAGPLAPRAFLAALGRCDAVVTVPGLSIVFEAHYFRCRTLFCLPMNYSQHRQSVVYRRVLHGAEFITWDEFAGYETLSAGLPEQVGVMQCLEFGHRFRQDKKSREHFARRFDTFLASCGDGLCIEGDNRMRRVDGATQIAETLLREQDRAAESLPQIWEAERSERVGQLE
jgi:hypothetical protein